jgi:hypothetical protein
VKKKKKPKLNLGELRKIYPLSIRPGDSVIVETQAGALDPEEVKKLMVELQRSGFEKVCIVQVHPGQGNLKFTVVRKRKMIMDTAKAYVES